MGAVVTITNPNVAGLSKVLEPGASLEFGREVGGVGRISDDAVVSRRHGVITATDDGFDVTSTGSLVGFVVADRTTPSRLHVPCGVGPIRVPFADSSVIVELDTGIDHLDVVVDGSAAAQRWRENWGPEMRDRWADVAAAAPVLPMTAPALAEVKWRRSNGRPYAWFLTLIAMCEPALGIGPAGTPTNRELARRRYVSPGVIERHMAQIYEAFGLADVRGARDVIVQIAVERGLVTRADVQELDLA